MKIKYIKFPKEYRYVYSVSYRGVKYINPDFDPAYVKEPYSQRKSKNGPDKNKIKK